MYYMCRRIYWYDLNFRSVAIGKPWEILLYAIQHTKELLSAVHVTHQRRHGDNNPHFSLAITSSSSYILLLFPYETFRRNTPPPRVFLYSPLEKINKSKTFSPHIIIIIIRVYSCVYIVIYSPTTAVCCNINRLPPPAGPHQKYELI